MSISILCYEHYNIYYACLVNAKVRLEEPNLRAVSVLKIQAAATIAYGGLLFPPERGEHGPPFPLAQVEAVSGYPTSDQIPATRPELDWISSIKLGSSLFSFIYLGDLSLPHRIVMAPRTRCRTMFPTK